MTTATADYGIVTEAGAIRFERLLPGPIERVWDYLVDSDKRATWLARGEMELRPGGAFEHVWRNNELTGHDDDVAPPKHKDHVEHRMAGVVLEVEPPRLLVEQWDSGKETQSEVMFELAEAGDKVRLTLTHRRLPNRGMLVGVGGGWHTHLDVLAARLDGREPPRFWATYTELDRAYEAMIPAE